MWHPDALDTFDDHLGNLSKSSNGYTQSTTILNDLKGRVDPGDVWITSINLSHWRLRSDQEKDLLEIEDGKDANKGAITDFPPKNVSDKRTLAEEGHHHLLSINEMSMSLVFTGDRMGRCWTCTIMCELIEESAMSTYIIEIMKIQQMFIHQQYAGRALCLLLLLGYMCQSLAIECESFAEELDKIMGMEVRPPDNSRNRLNDAYLQIKGNGATQRSRVAQVRHCSEKAEANCLGPRGLTGVR